MVNVSYWDDDVFMLVKFHILIDTSLFHILSDDVIMVFAKGVFKIE